MEVHMPEDADTPSRTVILRLTELDYFAIRDGLDTLNPDGDATEIVARAARMVSEAWDAAGQEGGIIAGLLPAARAAIPALILLGDFIGNTFDGKVGIPAFDRCAVIWALKTAIAQAESPASREEAAR
jgi:hypothetical protein